MMTRVSQYVWPKEALVHRSSAVQNIIRYNSGGRPKSTWGHGFKGFRLW